MKCNTVKSHRYFRVRRTWIDVSCAASRREGILLYRPGRKLLRIIPWLLSKLTFLPWPSRAGWNDILPGFDLEQALGHAVDYATIYIGNGSPRSKFTILASTRSKPLHGYKSVIVKLGNSAGAKAAIEQEYAALEKLQASALKDQTPKPLGKGQQGEWAWSAQSVLPKGQSPVRMQKEHEEFLEALKRIGLSHGDFAPWNCAIANGKLVAWDWEDAGPWEAGKDAAWFKTQVKTLLGIDA